LLSPEGLFSAQNAPQIVCRPGSARTRWGSLQRSPDPLSGLREPTSKKRKGRGGESGKEGKEREGIRMEGDGKGREGQAH